jgi:hypothetical protein
MSRLRQPQSCDRVCEASEPSAIILSKAKDLRGVNVAELLAVIPSEASDLLDSDPNRVHCLLHCNSVSSVIKAFSWA